MNSEEHKRDSGRFVLPGDFLGVIEEFIPDSGTYVKDGFIYSSVVGRTLIDFLNKKVSVFPVTYGAKVPRVGSIVIGHVSNVLPQIATVRIFRIGRGSLSGVFTGFLHISDAHPRFVESMFEVCKTGDILRAKVISTKNRSYHLSTKDRNLGVIYAFCSTCGSLLEQIGRVLVCAKCGNKERRKIAIDYGKGVV
ncbi:exosome complex RNA-binding protein Csl4 [Candidatus Bathyarchaeota archaeon]|nr:exosome complex RNA-binding protein Csl4 [Candidatus Bathyarchaeota archaeon]